MTLTVQTDKPRQVADITDRVSAQVKNHSGLVHLFVQHTTAALTTADLDPGTDLDLLDALAGMLPDVPWRHPHNPAHAPAHLLSSIIGPSVVIPCRQGKLMLGTWQRIVLIELDGPRERSIELVLL